MSLANIPDEELARIGEAIDIEWSAALVRLLNGDNSSVDIVKNIVVDRVCAKLRIDRVIVIEAWLGGCLAGYFEDMGVDFDEKAQPCLN